MNVLVITGLYPPEIGGPATYAKRLADYLPDHGITVSVLPFSQVRGYPKFIRHMMFTWRIFRSGRTADVLYAQDPVSVGFPTAIANVFLRKPFLLKIVGDYAWEQGVQRFGVRDTLDDFVKKPQRFSVRIFQWVQRYTANAAGRIIVPSNYLKSIVLAWEVRTPVTVVYNGISRQKPPENTPKMPENRRFLSVGRLVSWKGFEALIRVFSELPEEYTLNIVGDGPLKNDLAKLIDQQGLGNRIQLRGRMSREALTNSYTQYIALLLNTNYEGFSHQIIEAMAAGLPVITTPVGGNTEIISDRKNGLFAIYNDVAEWKDMIEEITNTEIHESLRFAGVEEVKKFTVEQMICETADILNNML